MGACWRGVAALAALFALSGCTSGWWEAPSLALHDPQALQACQSSHFTLIRSGANVDGTVADAKGNLTLDYFEYVGQDLNNIDLLLDCGLGAATTPRLKLLRGHILVALASKYAQFNVTGRVGPSVNIGFKSYDGMEDDAAAILAHLYNSELGMRHGLVQMTDATVLPSPTPSVDRVVERILPVAVLAIKSEVPGVNRGKTVVTTAIRVAAGDVTGLRDAGQVVAGAVGKMMVLNVLGTAYFNDARQSMAIACTYAGGSNCTPLTAVQGGSAQRLLALAQNNGDTLYQLIWQQWENELGQSCKALARFAGVQAHCIPTDAEAAQGFQD